MVVLECYCTTQHMPGMSPGNVCGTSRHEPDPYVVDYGGRLDFNDGKCPEFRRSFLYVGRVLFKLQDLYEMHVCRQAIQTSRFVWYHRFLHLLKLSESRFCVCRKHPIEVIHAELTRLITQSS